MLWNYNKYVITSLKMYGKAYSSTSGKELIIVMR